MIATCGRDVSGAGADRRDHGDTILMAVTVRLPKSLTRISNEVTELTGFGFGGGSGVGLPAEVPAASRAPPQRLPPGVAGRGGPPTRGVVAPRPLPDSRAQVGRAHHRIALLAPERLLELGEVGERTVHAPHRRRVPIGKHLGAQRRGP